MIDLFTKKDAQLRLAVLVLSASIGLLFVLLAPNQANAAVMPKNMSIVQDEKIRLKDVFQAIGEDSSQKRFERNKERVLGNAPKPGDDLVINASTLLRISSAFGLAWRPENNTDQVVIRREATVITKEEVEKHLITALKNKGLNERFSLLFYNGNQDIVLPGKQDPVLATEMVDYDPDKDVFEAVLKTSTDRTLTYSGKIERLIQVPVLKDSLRKDDIISAYDIDWIEMPMDHLHRDIVLKADSLIGMTPQRVIMSGKPVRLNEIIPPKIVNRGENVTIVFEHGPLTLTSKGKALQHGAKGDFVRVLNLSSNKTIEGFVISERTVQVQ